MSAAHSSGKPIPASGEVALVAIASDVGGAASAALERRRERRRIGLHGIGRRLADRQSPDPRLSQERRRIAADVHDLVMQDVSFALATARAIASDPGLVEGHAAAAAAIAAGERALAGARAIVSDLSGRDRRATIPCVRESVLTAARDVPLTLETCAPETSQADQLTTDALVHIGREAVTNAVKHAGAGAIHVSISRPDEWHLRVSDDGCGFDAVTATSGFGLESARLHAEELGGRLRLASTPGEGTVVEVFLP
jgi:signal transduction histidine kinase